MPVRIAARRSSGSYQLQPSCFISSGRGEIRSIESTGPIFLDPLKGIEGHFVSQLAAIVACCAVSNLNEPGAALGGRLARAHRPIHPDLKCHLPGAAQGAHPPPEGHYSGLKMPSLFIFFCNVERCVPRRAAAPFAPLTTQPVSRRATRMCSRSASASVSVEVGGRRSEVSGPSSAAGFSPLTSDPDLQRLASDP